MKRLGMLIGLVLFMLSAVCTAEKDVSGRMLRCVLDTVETADDIEAAPFMGLMIPREFIRTVSFLNTTEGAPETAVDYSADGNGGVLVWAEPEADGGLYDVFVAADGVVVANPDSSFLFYCCSSLEEVRFNGCFDTQNVTAMVSMYENCSSITVVDMSELEMSKVTDVSYMCAGCPLLREIRVNGLDLDSANTTGFFEGWTVEASEAPAETPTEAPQRGMTPYPCSRCGEIEQFPFVPRGDRPVYCSDCWKAMRGE